jgi:zinc protease
MPQVHTLDNGLTVVLVENHAAPVISFNVLIRVGSAFETDEEAGLSHFIEHMLFKGTPSRPVGEIAKTVEAAGGDINAYTSFDQTVYYINMASRFADTGLDILADAVQHPLFDAEEVKRESEVILEEVRRSKDSPEHEVSEKMFAATYGTHPYGRPIIGFEKTVKSFTRDSLQNYFNKWYVPSNMVFIVVGDFDPVAILDRLKNAFKDAPTVQKPIFNTEILTTLPPTSGPKLLQANSNIQATYFNLGFPIPHFTHHDTAIMDLLSQIMAGGESSRLEQIIRQKKHLVQQIYTYSFTPKGAGLFIIGGMLQEKNLSKTIDAVWKEIARLHTHPVSQEELDRAKLNLRSNRIYDKETVGGESGKYASFLAVTDDIQFEDQYYRWIEEATVDDIMDGARRYLRPERMSGVILSPNGNKVNAANLISSCKTPAIDVGKRTKLARPKPQVITMPGGFKLVVIENRHLPLTSFTLAGLGGLRAETPAINGINTLIGQTLTKGTKTRNALQIAEEIDAFAGSLDAFAGRNTLGIKCEFLSDKQDKALDLFFDILQNPTFPEREVEKGKRDIIEAIKSQDDQLASLAFYHFCHTLYGHHPYGMRVLGNRESVKSLTSKHLATYFKRALQTKNAVMTIVGDVNAKQIAEAVRKRAKFGAGTALALPKVVIPTSRAPQKIETIRSGKQQAHIVLGFLGSKYVSPDYYRLLVMNQILAGQGGRLFLELRDKLSLAYTVSSSLQMGIDPGFFAVYIGTDPSKVDTALKGMRRELEAMTKELVAPDELARAQEYLIGSHALEQQRLGAVAGNHTFNLLYGLGLKSVDDYPQKIAKITRNDILATAKKFFQFNREVLSIVKP